MFYNNDSDLTASEPSDSEGGKGGGLSMGELQRAGLGNHWESGRFSDSSSSGAEQTGFGLSKANGKGSSKKPKIKQQKKGVLSGGGQAFSVGEKFSYLQKQMLLK